MSDDLQSNNIAGVDPTFEIIIHVDSVEPNGDFIDLKTNMNWKGADLVTLRIKRSDLRRMIEELM